MPTPLQIRPYWAADWPAVWALLEPVFRAGETFPHDPAISEAEAQVAWVEQSLAGAIEATAIHGELEILSLCGTLSPDGSHLHIAVADRNGAVIGGHLCAGSLVRTTAELVIGLLPHWQFRRELDPATGYTELRISPQAPD